MPINSFFVAYFLFSNRCKLELLSCLVGLFHSVHVAGVGSNGEEGDNEAPTMDTLVALRLAIALMHARKINYKLVVNRYCLFIFMFHVSFFEVHPNKFKHHYLRIF